MDELILVVSVTGSEVPALIQDAGPGARFAYDEFLSALDSPHTTRAYRSAVERFLRHCETAQLRLTQVTPGLVGDYIKGLTQEVPVRLGGTREVRSASKATKKLHLAALRHFFDCAVRRHAIMLNPAASVRGPRHSVTEGATPAIDPKEARALLDSIDIASPIGLRDRTVIAALIYTAARVGALAKLRCCDFYTDGRQHYLRLDEKGGKQRSIPCRHDLEQFIEDYLGALGSVGEHSPLFRTALRRTGQFSGRGMTANDIYRMLKRRMAHAGLPYRQFSCHSFRAATATNLLDQGVELADVQYLLGHSDPRTTKLYDRRKLSVTRNIVERIAI